MRDRILVFLLLAATAALSASAKTAPLEESRTHYVIANQNRLPVYYATVISTNSEALNVDTYLLADPSGQRIQIEVRSDHKKHTFTTEYRLNGGPPSKVKFELPYKGSSRSENLKELKEHPEYKTLDVPVTLESLGQVLKTGEKEWNHGADKARLRGKAKAMFGPEMTTVMAKLRSVLAFPPLMGACTTLSFVTGGERCAASTALAIATVRPDCDFDAKFGLPCNGNQKQRAKDQPKNGKVGRY